MFVALTSIFAALFAAALLLSAAAVWVLSRELSAARRKFGLFRLLMVMVDSAGPIQFTTLLVAITCGMLALLLVMVALLPVVPGLSVLRVEALAVPALACSGLAVQLWRMVAQMRGAVSGQPVLGRVREVMRG